MAKKQVKPREQILQISLLPGKPLTVADLEADLHRALYSSRASVLMGAGLPAATGFLAWRASRRQGS